MWTFGNPLPAPLLSTWFMSDPCLRDRSDPHEIDFTLEPLFSISKSNRVNQFYSYVCDSKNLSQKIVPKMTIEKIW